MRVTSLAQLKKQGGLGRHGSAIEKAMKEQQAAKGSAYHKLQKAYETKTGGTLSAAEIVVAGGGKGLEPQALLWEMIKLDKTLSQYHWKEDYAKGVPGRSFELDACIPSLKIGIECDGHAFHGKYKAGFTRDREKMYLLSVNGWQVLQVQAGLIAKSPNDALERVKSFVAYWEPRQRLLQAHGFDT